jgi:hypothetical protein
LVSNFIKILAYIILDNENNNGPRKIINRENILICVQTPMEGKNKLQLANILTNITTPRP